MNWDKEIRQVAEELGLGESEARDAYMEAWRFIREKIGELKLRQTSKEDFRKLKTSFNMPSFGKFGVTDRRFDNMVKRAEYMKKAIQNAKNKED